MAWTAPKVDWDPPDAILDSHLNAIGENLVYLKAHADATSGVHGGVSVATPSTFMVRDVAGRVRVVAPASEEDVALKSTVSDEAALRVAADAVLQGQITAIGTSYVLTAGDTMTGQLVCVGPDTDYTTAQARNIKLMTTVPNVGDLANGGLAFVYEVP